ncbi:hypothetical protein F444_13837 [Phytophthora nicotianae P1976]|uniref:Uncharacterized protein n=1 Tax=Phytophthora nicotianae P1976 TaxID=1317066 RepID=A0A080ZSK3_PHYNI|nr:hypothetical protein F444_13837 [Phytophthora nicotianae P1976]
MKSTSNADIAVLPEETATSSILTPSCNYKKLCSNLSAYMDVSGQLRAKRKEVYEADQRRELKDQQAALDLSVEVAKLKHLSDRMRLLLCGQLREVINEIHQHLNITSKQTNDGSANAIETNGYTLELADKCTELLHSITFTAIKEEIYEKERLQSNALLHNGKSTAYIVLRSRWRVRPRSW